MQSNIELPDTTSPLLGGSKLSVVIPAHNEEGSIKQTIIDLREKLVEEGIEHEILIINDNSSDGTERVLKNLSLQFDTVKYLNNEPPNGFGLAVKKGLENFSGGIVAVYMADASDLPSDLVRFYRTIIEKKVDCVFGSRFIKGSRIVQYPLFKLVLNRIFNFIIQVLFSLKYNDVTNAFKMYRRSVISGVQPLLSHHFNMTVEIPLKAIVRGYSYTVVPNTWINRKLGESKLKVKEMGSRYLFIVLHCLLEKWLSRGDYHSRQRILIPCQES